MKSTNWYVVAEHEGIYEILRMDYVGTMVVVQTNIRTPEKAEQARETWQKRENEKHERKT